jgi:hypothetical protein
MTKPNEQLEGQTELTGVGFDRPEAQETASPSPERAVEFRAKEDAVKEVVDRFDKAAVPFRPDSTTGISRISLETRITVLESQTRENGPGVITEAERSLLYSFMRHNFDGEQDIENLVDGMKARLKQEELKASRAEEEMRRAEIKYDNGFSNAVEYNQRKDDYEYAKKKSEEAKDILAFLEKYILSK